MRPSRVFLHDCRPDAPAHQKKWIPLALIAIAALLVGTFAWLVRGSGSVDTNKFVGQTAPAGNPAPLPDLSNGMRVAYEHVDDISRPGGRGFVDYETVGDQTRIAGFHGATGDRLWWFGSDGEDYPRGLEATGTGPNSTVIVRMGQSSSESGDEIHGVSVGLDASTGERLWVNDSLPDLAFWDVNDQLALSGRSDEVTEQWTAVDPRTGEVLWTKPRDGAGIAASVNYRLTENHFILGPEAVVELDSDLAAIVYNARTGEEERRFTMTDLRKALPDAADLELVEARGNTAVIQSGSYPSERPLWSLLLDMKNGSVRAVPGSVMLLEDGWTVTRSSDENGSAVLHRPGSSDPIPTQLIGWSRGEENWARTAGGWVAVTTEDRETYRANQLAHVDEQGNVTPSGDSVSSDLGATAVDVGVLRTGCGSAGMFVVH